ncbi:hypothetical protein Syun_006867 [Stephania yunnanensis]|uniref:Uncharacterized protein n=1 Tax=Stephania yunnanensis TaxID=152371 RepID=A0AAP0Q1T3_9MAGN
MWQDLAVGFDRMLEWELGRKRSATMEDVNRKMKAGSSFSLSNEILFFKRRRYFWFGIWLVTLSLVSTFVFFGLEDRQMIIIPISRTSTHLSPHRKPPSFGGVTDVFHHRHQIIPPSSSTSLSISLQIRRDLVKIGQLKTDLKGPD